MISDSSKLFNRSLYQQRRARRKTHWAEHNFLKQEAAARIADDLMDVQRRFSLALDLGSHGGEVAETIAPRVGRVIRSDFLPSMHPHIVCDEELLPFADNNFDLIVSALSLHHVNDLPGTLIQVQRCLKPDGLFLAILPGANTLRELRESITQASAQQGFALCPRLSPLVEIRDAGALLQRAGFALPVVDSDTFTIEYSSVHKLLADLRGMGESNVLHAQHKGFTSRTQLAAITAHYEAMYGAEGHIPATVEFVTISGWKPHASQQIPAARGSGQTHMKHVL